MSTHKPPTLRLRVYQIVEPAEENDQLSKLFDITIMGLIVANIIAMITQSVPEIASRWDTAFARFELISVLIFSIEYVPRLWACVENPNYYRPIKGRMRYAISPLALIDFISIAPFFMPFFGWDLRFTRAFRLFRLARLAKLTRYTSAVARIQRVLIAKRDELLASLSFMLILIIVSSSLLYFAERYAQPEHFGSIPAAMWWAIVTLTTVGYGDIYPITTIGKVLAASIALLGVGMVALPTSILGAGFVEEMAKNTKKETVCPHCGERIGHE